MSDVESRLYRDGKFSMPGAHWDRIENAIGIGMPDVNVAFNRFEYWIELKRIYGSEPGTMPVRVAQRQWIKHRYEAGMENVLIIVGSTTGRVNHVMQGNALFDPGVKYKLEKGYYHFQLETIHSKATFDRVSSLWDFVKKQYFS